MSYDADGNNLGNSFNGTTRTQVWDEENRLKQVSSGGGSLAKFRCNDSGERTKKQTAAGDSWYVNQYLVLLPVQGDLIHFAEVDRTMSLGPTGQATITSDIVARRR